MERNVGERKGNETQNRARNKRELIKRVKDTRDGYTKRGKKEKKNRIHNTKKSCEIAKYDKYVLFFFFFFYSTSSNLLLFFIIILFFYVGSATEISYCRWITF